MYFEYNLPSDLSWINETVREEYRKAFASIAKRMEKLQKALDVTPMKPDTFAVVAKKIWETFPAWLEDLSPGLLSVRIQEVWDGEEAPERLEFPNAETVIDTRFVTTKEWEMIRHIGIGGSDAAVLSGKSPWRTKRDLFYDKTAAPTREDGAKKAIFARGHFVEESVVNAFCRLTGAKRIPESRMFRSKKHQRSLADIDALVEMPGGQIYIFEAKTTAKQNAAAWADGKIPEYYVDQTRQYAAVLGDERIRGTFIGCLFCEDYTLGDTYLGSNFDPKQFVSRLVERRWQSEEQLLALEDEFFSEYVMKGIVPSRSGDADRDMATLKLYEMPEPEEKEEPRILPSALLKSASEMNALDLEIASLKEQLKAKENEKETLKIGILAAMKGHTSAFIPESDESYWEVSYKETKSRMDVDKEKLELAFPDAYQQCLKEVRGYSRFSIKRKTVKAAKKKPA